VTFGNGLTVRELIVDVDDEARRLVWSARGGSLTHHNAAAQVFADDEQHCRLVWTADILPHEAAPVIRAMIDQGAAAMQRALGPFGASNALAKGLRPRRHCARAVPPGIAPTIPRPCRRGVRSPRARAPRAVPQPQLLKLLSRRLEHAGIAYMVTGSIASSLQGEPRATHDIDLVVAIEAPAAAVVAALRAAFPEPEFHLDEAAVGDAIHASGMFNVIDTVEGDKVDFWVLTDDPFDRARFERRYIETFEDARLFVSSPEDTILMKLRWAAMLGGSDKQFVDALRVYEVQHGRLDEGYMDRWALTLGVAGALARLRAEARPIA
jgi:hypothetical protein